MPTVKRAALSVLVAEDMPPDDSDSDDHPLSHAVSMTGFRQAQPRPELLECLAWLVAHNGPSRQKAIIEALVEGGIIRSKAEGNGKALSPQAKQGQFRSVVEGLQRFGFAQPDSSGNLPKWEPTDQAGVALALFRGRKPK